ncbi:MAG: allantoinase AllB [Zestosphaera sp.]
MSYGASLLVKGGTLVTPDGLLRADVKIVEGKVTAIGNNLTQAEVEEVLDASNLLIFPGVVDEHVHMREPGLEYKEDFSHGTSAAAVGGVTTVIEHPNTLPPVENSSKLVNKAKLLESKAWVDFALHGVLHDSNSHELEDMVGAGAVGFKVYMGPTVGDLPSPSEGTLYEILAKSSQLGLTLMFHAEDRSLVEFFTKRIATSGRSDLRIHEDSRPPITEETSILKLIILSKRTGGRAHIAHVASTEAVELIRRAAADGVKVSGEVCPHYITFTNDDYVKYGALIKVFPPIRGRTHRESLLRAIKEGVISALGSDHAPHAREEKLKNIWEAPAGISGVQTFFLVFLDLALKGELPITVLPKLMSENPAKLFGLWPRKGSLRVGSDGDLVIVDPRGRTRVTEEWLRYKNRVTPYLGWEFQGEIRHVVIRGHLVVRGGLLSEKPVGVWLKRTE